MLLVKIYFLAFMWVKYVTILRDALFCVFFWIRFFIYQNNKGIYK